MNTPTAKNLIILFCAYTLEHLCVFITYAAQAAAAAVRERVTRTDLLEVVYREPDLALRVEHAAQVAPGNREVGPRLDRLQVAGLETRIHT